MADRQTQEKDIDLVLVTGAGASHEFGVNHSKMPLMSAWSDALVDKIGKSSWAYLEATGLTKDLGGPEFEQRLGRFLQMAQALPQVDQVLKPSLEFQAPPPNLNEQSLRQWHQNAMFHVGKITNLIHESLYEAFSYEHMDLDAAAQAYGMLLGQLGINNTHSMVYATTNYDLVGEYVIERLSGLPDWGERHNLMNQGESPLRVERLLDGMPRYVPVLHLHGRIGWYLRDGRPISANITRHNEGFGIPIVMLPDPDKDYDLNPVIFSLWSQFEEALRRARRVLVLGHSLNDRSLIEALRQNVTPAERVAVTVLGESGQPAVIASDTGRVSEILSQDLPSASIIPIYFAQNSVSIEEAVAAWNNRLARAIDRRPT
jgi:hypothetical protein